MIFIDHADKPFRGVMMCHLISDELEGSYDAP